MTRYTYKGYVLLNGGGYCRVYKDGSFIAVWPRVADCKMMIDGSIREGVTLDRFLDALAEKTRQAVDNFHKSIGYRGEEAL